MFSYQLYSSRNFPPLADTLKMLAEAGYTGVEGYGALYANDELVAQLGAALKDTGLSMATGHFGLVMLETEVDKVLSDIGADEVPRILVYNKIDEAGYEPRVERDEHGTIARVFVSALRRAGLDGLRGAIVESGEISGNNESNNQNL